MCFVDILTCINYSESFTFLMLIEKKNHELCIIFQIKIYILY